MRNDHAKRLGRLEAKNTTILPRIVRTIVRPSADGPVVIGAVARPGTTFVERLPDESESALIERALS